MRLVLVLGCLTLAACGTISRIDRDPAYIVQPGDTLYSIAWRYGVDYRTLASWNELENPDLILVGQRIRLPPSALAEDNSRAVPPAVQASRNAPAQRASTAQQAETPPAGGGQVTAAPPPARAGQGGAVPPQPPDRRVAAPGPAVPSSGSPASGPTSVPRASRGAAVAAGASSAPSTSPSPAPSATPASRSAAAQDWQWPTQGPVISEFGSSEAISSGIGIGGQAGQSINAAAAGNVVYAGSGLNRYGQLVIIKHDDTFLSAYGYNDRLLVDQGDAVRQGQKIAEMGFGPERTARLHFEIRRNGVPVNPAQYLSAR